MIDLGKKRGQYGSPSASYESVIPLVLILILGIFIAGKFGILNLSSLPVIGSLFGAPYIKIAVILVFASFVIITLIFAVIVLVLRGPALLGK